MAIKVLLADDSVPAQNMGKKILADAGYEVMAVSNGLEALKKIADSVPDIAILDIFMPGYTGLEVCSRLRGNAVTADLPVILTVGKLEPYRPEDGEKVKSSAVIVKPFSSEELVSAVRSLVGLPFAIRRDVPEERPAAAPAPANQPEPEDDYEEEAPMLAGIGFDGVAGASDSGGLGWNPDAKRTAFSASAAVLPQQDDYVLAIDHAEGAPATPSKVAINPRFFEAASAVEVAAAPPVLTDFEMEPETPSFGQAGALPPQQPSQYYAGDPEPDGKPVSASGSTAATAALVEWWQPAEFATGLGSRGVEANPAAAAPAMADALAIENLPVHGHPAETGKDTPNAIRAEAIEQTATETPALQQAALPVAGVVVDDLEHPFIHPVEAAVQDRESRMQAFEALFNSDEAIPLEENPAALSDLLAEEELTASQMDEAGTDSLLTLEVAPDAAPPIATAASALQNGGPAAELEPVSAGELQLAADDIAEWLSTGMLPHDPEPPVSAALERTSENSAAPIQAGTTELGVQAPPTPACDSFYAGMPDDLEPPQTETAEASAPTLCCLPNEPAGEIAHESAFELSLEPAVTGSAPAESLPSQFEQPQEQPQVAAQEPASAVLQWMTAELVHPEVEIAKTAEENIEESESVSASENGVRTSELVDAVPEAKSGNEANRIHQAVESVFDRFRPLLIAAIARELTKRD